MYDPTARYRTIVDTFIERTADERPDLGHALAALGPEAQSSLAGVLGRFDRAGRGQLDAEGRLLASRILLRLRVVDGESLAVANRVLDYLDLDSDARLDEAEMELCVKILEAYARAESDDEQVSTRELKMLYAVLRHLDSNHNGRLDAAELRRLHESLAEPANGFMERQRRENPWFRELLR